MKDPAVAVKAPLLGVAELRALQRALEAIDRGRLQYTGLYPRVYPVRGSLKFATGWAWNNRCGGPPAASPR